MATTDPFFHSLPGLFPTSPPRTPDREQARNRQSSISVLSYDTSWPVHELQQVNLQRLAAESETSVPTEYQFSRSADGTMPNRVLHLRSISSGTETKPIKSYDGTDAGSFEARPYTGTSSSAGEMLNQKDEQAKSNGGFNSPLQSHTLTIEDSNVVDWDGPNDPENPMNWSGRKKGIAVAMASIITFVTPLASSMFAPGVPLLMHDFHSSSSLLSSFVVSVYLIGFVVGPMIVAPASELIGRVPCYHVGNVLFVAFSVGCAKSTNLGMFIAFRLLQGAAGATPLTNGGATIGDIIPREKRGKALAAWALGPLIGPVTGPVIGGFLVEKEGWRWVFWLLAICSGFLTILCFILLRETYAPVILQRKTNRLRKETGNHKLHSNLGQELPMTELFLRAIVRPLKMLFLSPIVFLLSLNVSIIFSYLYLLFTTFTYVFEKDYKFNSGEAGLAYLGLGAGMMIGLPLIGRSSDTVVKKLTASNDGVFKPEYRLQPLIFGPSLMACGLFGYGWTAQEHVHWIAPILLTIPCGIGLIAAFFPTQAYMVDGFGPYAASAIAATTIMRSLFAAVIPLAGQSLYDRLGLGWGNSLLGFISLLMVPVAFALVKYGERIRNKFKVQF